MNYAEFGESCYFDLIGGCFSFDQHYVASHKVWATGSDNTTQVNYCRCRGACNSNSLAGFTAILQDDNTSFHSWTVGSQ